MSSLGEHLTEAQWVTSSYTTNSRACVEVALASEVAGVRDSKDRDGGTLVFDREQWRSFVAGIKA